MNFDKYVVLSILLISSLTSFSYSGTVPMLVLDQQKKGVETIAVEEKKYSQFLRRTLRKAKRNYERRPRYKKLRSDLNLDTIVVGLGVDARIGFFDWNISAGSAVEFHMKVLP